MQVSSYLKNARRSMRHKLIGYMIVLAVLLVAALYAGLTLFGRLSSPKAEIKKALDLQMEIFQNDMESLWHNVSVMSLLLSEDMTALLEDTLQQQGISFEDLDGNVEATKAIEDAMLEPLSQYVRQADCSGGFVVLESSMSDWDAADARSGLYVQRANAGRVTNNLLLFRGIASVGKAHNVMPHRKWAQEFHIGQFPNYAEHTVQAAAPIADSRRTTDLVTLPGTSEKAVLLTIPMIGADGTVYGMCGFAINQSYFSARYDQPSNLSRLACLLTTESGDTLDAGAALMTYTEEGFCYVPPETLTVKPMSDGLVSLNGDGFSFVGMVKSLTAAKRITISLLPKILCRRLCFRRCCCSAPSFAVCIWRAGILLRCIGIWIGCRMRTAAASRWRLLILNRSPPRCRRRIGNMRRSSPRWSKKSRPCRSRPCSFWIGTRSCKGSLKQRRPTPNGWPTSGNPRSIRRPMRCSWWAMIC